MREISKNWASTQKRTARKKRSKTVGPTRFFLMYTILWVFGLTAIKHFRSCWRLLFNYLPINLDLCVQWGSLVILYFNKIVLLGSKCPRLHILPLAHFFHSPYCLSAHSLMDLKTYRGHTIPDTPARFSMPFYYICKHDVVETTGECDTQN